MHKLRLHGQGMRQTACSRKQQGSGPSLDDARQDQCVPMDQYVKGQAPLQSTGYHITVYLPQHS